MEKLGEMLKGVLEGVVLEIIGRGEIYGYAIVKALHTLGFTTIAEGTVYALLVRIEKNKLVKITKKPSEIGPPRKFYTLNKKGEQTLQAFWTRWHFLKERLALLEKDGGEG